MKKELKKLFAVIFAFALVFTALCISVSAENETAEGSQISDTARAPEDTNAEDVSPNIFETVYREAARHADKILSLLAFITSLAVALGYKKTLMPVIKVALSKLSSSVIKSAEDTEKRCEEAEMRLRETRESFEEAKAIFKSLSDRFDALCLKLDEANKIKKTNGDIKILMNSQIDMLYEVFISSSLPIYQKEAVGARISEMKRIIAEPCGEIE